MQIVSQVHNSAPRDSQSLIQSVYNKTIEMLEENLTKQMWQPFPEETIVF